MRTTLQRIALSRIRTVAATSLTGMLTIDVETLTTIAEDIVLGGDFLWQAQWTLLLKFMISGTIHTFVFTEGMVNQGCLLSNNP